MPSLADLLSPGRQIKVETPSGTTLQITYRPDSVTVGQQIRFAEAKRSADEVALAAMLVEWLADTVTEWDLTLADDHTLWPINPESLQRLPTSVMTWIFQAINSDAAPEPGE